MLAVASDGAGSARWGGEGSRWVCQSLVKRVISHLDAGGRVEQLDRTTASSWLAEVRHELSIRAKSEERELKEFACTMLLTVAGPRAAAFWQVGDGALVFRIQGGDYALPFWPEKGGYVNETFFITDAKAADHLQTEVVLGCIEEVALLTDGVEGLALRYKDSEVHEPFFNGLFPSLSTVRPGTSPDPGLSDALATFLNSERVNARTDDDKTIVLASRSVVPPAEKAARSE